MRSHGSILLTIRETREAKKFLDDKSGTKGQWNANWEAHWVFPKATVSLHRHGRSSTLTWSQWGETKVVHDLFTAINAVAGERSVGDPCPYCGGYLGHLNEGGLTCSWCFMVWPTSGKTPRIMIRPGTV